jgi:hypothetical protein
MVNVVMLSFVYEPLMLSFFMLSVIKMNVNMLNNVVALFVWRHDSQHNDIWHNDIRQNERLNSPVDL